MAQACYLLAGVNVTEWIKRWLTPTETDPELAYHQRLVKLLLLLMGGATILASLAILALTITNGTSMTSLGYAITVLLFYGVAAMFAQRGQVRLAALIVTVGLLTVVMVAT